MVGAPLGLAGKRQQPQEEGKASGNWEHRQLFARWVVEKGGQGDNQERCDILLYMYLAVVGPPAGSRGASQVWGRQMGEGASRR